MSTHTDNTNPEALYRINPEKQRFVSHEPGQFEWLWHPGGEVKKRGGDLEITAGESSVVLRPLYPEPLAPSGYVHDYPNHLWWEVLEGPTDDLRQRVAWG